MDAPVMMDPRRVTADTDVLPAYVPIPGMGILAVHAFVVHAAEPVLVDAGVRVLKEAFMDELRTRIDPRDLRWIWLTHTDPDHVGAVEDLLVEAPDARIVTTYLGMGKMSLQLPIPPERVYLLNPGRSLDVGDRRLLAVKPPTYDAPETTAVLDSKTRAFFSADSFGALLHEPADDAAAIPPADLSEGSITWATVDAPWLHAVERSTLELALRVVHELEPSVVLSAHLPPARDMTDKLLSYVAQARTASPFVGPDQDFLVHMATAVSA